MSENLLAKNRALLVKAIRKLQEDISCFYNDSEIDNHRYWQLLLDHFFVKKTGSPSAKWKRITVEMVGYIGETTYLDYIDGFLVKLTDLLELIHQTKTGGETYFLLEQFQELYKGIIWSISLLEDGNPLYGKIEGLALWCFKKIPKHGAVSVKLGNACLYCFCSSSNGRGIGYLLSIRNKVLYPSVRKKIDAYLEEVAAKMGLSIDEVLELSVEDFGLSAYHHRVYLMGDYRVVVELKEDNVLTNWYKGDVLLKSIPSSIKRNYEEDYALFKKDIKELKQALSVQRKRLEGLFLGRRKWFFEDWKKKYLSHPLVGFFAKRILWRFIQGEKEAVVLYTEDGWLSKEGVVIEWVDRETIVEIWHPIYSEVEEVLWWRDYIVEKEIQQPFKQAFREVYLLTDAERRTNTYSNRFAAHILRQHQFAALCKVRGWRYKLKGYWESKDIPSIVLSKWGLSVEFWVDVDWDGELTEGNAFKLIFTDQVRFYDQEDVVALETVPLVVFSEVMRDVDLFVGVTSIGNDPAWQDNSTRHNDYWFQYSFSALTEAAKSRKAALEKIIPKLRIADQCTLNGRFLEVRGAIRTYKIHLGSGNILMSPNDRYLCIIPNAKQEKTELKYLPFDGDKIMSIIISKALLLANDRKIKDPVILEQILD